MRVALLGSLAVLFLADAASTAVAPRSALTLARAHQEFATALSRALPLHRRGDRVLAASSSLAANQPSIRVTDTGGRSLTISTSERGEATIEDHAPVFASTASVATEPAPVSARLATSRARSERAKASTVIRTAVVRSATRPPATRAGRRPATRSGTSTPARRT